MWNSKAATVIVLMAIIVIIAESEAKPPSKVTGGGNVFIGELPYNVRLLNFDYNDHPNICGGAIISSRHILTAAHCLHNTKNVVVFAGVTNYFDKNRTVVDVTNFVKHPYFRYAPGAEGGQYDVGILILPYDLTLGGRVDKIDLPQNPVNKYVAATFAGWGRIDPGTRSPELRKARITFKETADCPEEPYALCGISQQSGLCVGDSGSPVVSEGVVVGVASQATCEIGKVHRYTNVYYHMKWIKSIMRST